MLTPDVKRQMIDSLLDGYRQGAFLMDNGDGLQWYTVEQRALVPLDDRFHVPRRLERTLGRFELRTNTDFEGVVRGCANRAETWISPELRRIYQLLHEAGHAHSFEAWQGDRLAGGVLGITFGSAFVGESMFHDVTDASKAALVGLVRHLRARGFTMFDAQIQNPHLARFGTYEVTGSEYDRQLQQALANEAHF